MDSTLQNLVKLSFDIWLFLCATRLKTQYARQSNESGSELMRIRSRLAKLRSAHSTSSYLKESSYRKTFIIEYTVVQLCVKKSIEFCKI